MQTGFHRGFIFIPIKVKKKWGSERNIQGRQEVVRGMECRESGPNAEREGEKKSLLFRAQLGGGF